MRTRRTGSPANASEHTFVCLVPTQQVELSSSQEVVCSSVVISLSILLSGVWKMSQINIRWANISTTASNDWKGAFKRATVAFWVVSVSPFKSSKWGFPLKVHSCFSFRSTWKKMRALLFIVTHSVLSFEFCSIHRKGFFQQKVCCTVDRRMWKKGMMKISLCSH